jgi:hypothetical protein
MQTALHIQLTQAANLLLAPLVAIMEIARQIAIKAIIFIGQKRMLLCDFRIGLYCR